MHWTIGVILGVVGAIIYDLTVGPLLRTAWERWKWKRQKAWEQKQDLRKPFVAGEWKNGGSFCSLLLGPIILLAIVIILAAFVYIIILAYC